VTFIPYKTLRVILRTQIRTGSFARTVDQQLLRYIFWCSCQSGITQE